MEEIKARTEAHFRFDLSQPLYEIACLVVGETYCEIDTITSDAYKGHPEIFQVWSDDELCATVDFGIKEIYLEEENTKVAFAEVLKFFNNNVETKVDNSTEQNTEITEPTV